MGGAVLQLTQDGLHQGPWGERRGGGGTGDRTEGTFTCAPSKLGEICFRFSQEIPEKGIWGREKSGSQRTQKRKHRACPRKTQGTGDSEEGLEVLGEEGDVPLKAPWIRPATEYHKTFKHIKRNKYLIYSFS